MPCKNLIWGSIWGDPDYCKYLENVAIHGVTNCFTAWILNVTLPLCDMAFLCDHEQWNLSENSQIWLRVFGISTGIDIWYNGWCGVVVGGLPLPNMPLICLTLGMKGASTDQGIQKWNYQIEVLAYGIYTDTRNTLQAGILMWIWALAGLFWRAIKGNRNVPRIIHILRNSW